MTASHREISEQYKWDLSGIYPTAEAFWADYDRAVQSAAKFSKHEKTMLQSAESLFETLEDMTALERLIDKLYEYASLHFDTDMSDNTYQAMRGKVMNLANDAGAASYFVQPKLLKLSEKTVKEWMQAYPPLAAYRRTLEGALRCRPYTLSDACEKLLADLQKGMDTASPVRGILTNSDLTHGKIRDEQGKLTELTEANFIPFLMCPNRRVRSAAFRKMYATYHTFGNTFATLLDGFVREKSTLARVNRHKSSLDAAVFPDEVGTDIYRNLIDTVGKHLGVLFDYYDLKREMLGVSTLHLYDAYTPLLGEYDRSYTFEEAVDAVLHTVRVFGQEYHDVLERGIKEEHWVDVYPSKGKRGGAYSAGSYDTLPYILMNFKGKYDDVSTLAHEAGHSMHSYFSRKYNAPQNSSYRIFVAEVASTVNELLLARKRLRESTDRLEQLSILNQLMETYKGTLFRQTMFAEFEEKIYALSESGEVLTRDLLCETYYALVKKYFGPRVAVDSQIASEWMRIPHFYYFFYVYKYATCISAASAIVRKIETEGDEYVGRYLEFLKCGNTKSPLDSLKLAGVDLSRPEVVEDAIGTFAETVAQFRRLQKQK